MTSAGNTALGAYVPQAQQLQAMGRGPDSMLVHMTPGELNSLQGLAMAHGGSLTINPQTGLPEAGFLSKILPTILGFGLNFLLPGAGAAVGSALGGIGSAAGTGLIVGAGTTAITGDLSKGFSAGLGAFGGASLGGALKTGATVGTAGATTAATPPIAAAPAASVSAPAISSLPAAGSQYGLANAASQATLANSALATAPSALAPAAGAVVPQVAKTGLAALPQNFANAAQAGATGIAKKLAVPLAAAGLFGSLGGGSSGGGSSKGKAPTDNSYEGPYYSDQRAANFAPSITTPEGRLSTPDILASSKERDYFKVDQPSIFNVSGQLVQPGSNTAPGTLIRTPTVNPLASAKKGIPQYQFGTVPYMVDPNKPTGMAEGGAMELSPGAFVMPARETAEFGNGSTEAGQERLASMGGVPIKGKGDGVSDDIPARIGDRDARLANGETYFPPAAVKRLGKGDIRRGTDKLYAMMKKAEMSRKRAARGGQNKGLGALR